MLIRYAPKLKMAAKFNDLELMEKSLSLAQTIYAEKTSNFAQLYNNLGGAYQRIHNYSKALFYHRKSYEIRKELREHADYDISWVMIPYLNVAICCLMLNEFKDALKIAREVHEERCKILKMDHHHLIQTKEILMKCLIMQNQPQEAENIYTELINFFQTNNHTIGKYSMKSLKDVWDSTNAKKNS